MADKGQRIKLVILLAFLISAITVPTIASYIGIVLCIRYLDIWDRKSVGDMLSPYYSVPIYMFNVVYSAACAPQVNLEFQIKYAIITITSAALIWIELRYLSKFRD